MLMPKKILAHLALFFQFAVVIWHNEQSTSFKSVIETTTSRIEIQEANVYFKAIIDRAV